MKTAIISSLLLSATLMVSPSAARAEQAISPAEQHLFLDHHLANVGQVKVLDYSYDRDGSAPGAFRDSVTVTLGAEAAPGRRNAHVRFLSGANVLELPDADAVTGNPVVLSFLERDVREMQRITKGQANYFRKRVRLALADSAGVEAVRVDWNGQSVPAWKISVTPYVRDPLRARFESLADKTYEFVLSEQVPGWVYEMRSLVKDAAGAPYIREVLRYRGGQP